MNNTASARPILVVFEVYRHYKTLLRMGVEPSPVPLPAVPGYEAAQDPDLIRAPYRASSPTEREAIGSEGTAWVRHANAFCQSLDRKVAGLPPYQRDIIRTRYLFIDEELHDVGAWERLKQAGWYHSFRTYERQKAKALAILEQAMQLPG